MTLRHRLQHGVAATLLLCVAFAAAAQTPGKGAIASGNPLATQAGLEILEQGGNAFDAAVAVSAALAVVEPFGSGMGGGGFYLLHRASDGFETMLDAREKAPAAATPTMYLDAKGEPVPGASTDGPLAAGIPGEPAGWVWLASRYGRLPLAQSLAPAIRLAREGFPMYARLQKGLGFKREDFLRSPAATKVFLNKGAPPAIGEVLRQPDLARTLELLAAQGADGFYRGAFAKKLVDNVRRGGGIWTLEDLANYEVKERAPVVGTYHGARIVSAAPPSSGGIALIDALNILSGYDLAKVDSATRKHLIIEALRRAHRDRATLLGDPDFTPVPMAQLTSLDYAAGQRTAIRLDKAMPSALLPGVADDGSGNATTHFSVLDKDGNRVAATITLNLWFGTGWMAPGTGVLLNNQMDDFSLKPGVPNAYGLVGGDANAIAPGKRPLSSTTPTFVETDKSLMILGTPGGSRIIAMVLLGVLTRLDGGDAAAVAAAPRFQHQYLPDVVSFESQAFTEAERAALQKRGHQLQETRIGGDMQVVTWDYATGAVQAASDPRNTAVDPY
jgi:gamma-glutamyltranspeptidase/glutathione hydrolase